MIELNTQLIVDMDVCRADITINRGFINSSFVSQGNMHSHPYHEIHFIISGRNRIKLENMNMIIKKGDILLIPPGLSHSILPVPDGGEHKRAAFWLDLDCTVKDEAYIKKLFKRISEWVVISDCHKMCNFIEEIQQEFVYKQIGCETKVKASLAILLVEIFRRLLDEDDAAAEPNSINNSIMVAIEDYILKNYSKNCTIENLADILFISSRQLSRLIYNLYGKSFRTLLLETRMSTANYLIEETSLSFEEIAEKTGYSSVDAFYHAYCSYNKITPGEYRRRFKSN